MRSSRAKRISSACADVDAVVISNASAPFLDPLFWYVTEQRSGTFEWSFAIISSASPNRSVKCDGAGRSGLPSGVTAHGL